MSHDPDQLHQPEDAAILARSIEKALRRGEQKRGLARETEPVTEQTVGPAGGETAQRRGSKWLISSCRSPRTMALARI